MWYTCILFEYKVLFGREERKPNNLEYAVDFFKNGPSRSLDTERRKQSVDVVGFDFRQVHQIRESGNNGEVDALCLYRPACGRGCW